MSITVESLNDRHIDILREIGNIGAGNAATALSSLLNTRIDMDVPNVRIVDFREVPMLLGGEENIVSSLYFGMEGKMQGNIMLILDLESTQKIVKIMLKNISTKNLPSVPEERKKALKAIAKSATLEIGNILAGTYISALSTLTNIHLNMTVPSLCVDMAGAILSVPAIEFGQVSDKVLFIESLLYEGKEVIEISFFLIPNEASFDALMQSLNVQTP